MYEWHGWAVIRSTAAADDDEDPSPAVVAGLRRLLDESAAVDNETADLRVANGAYHVWLAGMHNHPHPGCLGIFRGIAAMAPGSYGVLYTFDSDLANEWDRWVMRRGHVHREQDHGLSPFIGLVEDKDPLAG